MANANVMAKSLHTVTVLVTMARVLQDNGKYPTAQDAVIEAAALLGYTPDMDTYGLIAAAVKKMNRI